MRVNRGARLALRVVLSVAALAVTISLIDLRRALAALTSPDPAWLLLCLILHGVLLGVLALRWYWLCKQLGVPVSWRRALREYMLSAALNTLLPGGFVGDIVRGHRGASDAEPEQRGRIWLSVVVDRGLGQLWVWLFTACTLSWWLPSSVAQGSAISRSGWVALALLGAGVLIALSARWLGHHRPQLIRQLAELLQGSREPRIVLGHLAIAVLQLSTWVAMFFCAARGLSGAQQAPDLLRAAIPTLAAASVPGFVNGWGAREGGASLAYGWVGLDPALGTATSVTLGGVGLLFGVLMLAFVTASRPAQRSAESPEDSADR